MNIGDAAERTGLPPKTIRYYEDIGLVVADRQQNGYRDYSRLHVERLAFLKRAREFGFPIEDCRKLLCLYEEGHSSKSEVRALAAHHLAELRHKAQQIHSLAESLQTLVEACTTSNGDGCPIIDELARKPHASPLDLSSALAFP
jgi:MerR family transcriptional regulator, copper efflux regulator